MEPFALNILVTKKQLPGAAAGPLVLAAKKKIAADRVFAQAIA